MAFDQTTRNRLQKFVLEARDLLRKELTRQMQHDFGMDPETGKISEIGKLTHLDDARQETARMLRDTFDHYMAAQPFGGEKGTLDRIAREQAFTVLNRLCALRMAEARGFLIESIANGHQSKGFQLYARLAGHSLGELGEAYQCYLFSLFDEFAVDLPVLFDRYSAMGRLFPKDTALRELLDLINAPDIAHLWAEDETIGWIYQYFNSKEERRQMRDASQAPRNSRELAVRNQFFTPRYVVEFLTDNTLGRIWYEMTQGNTALAEDCQYLVRRPDEVFLSVEQGPVLDWFQGNDQESEPRVQNIAHSVNGCLRAGGLHEGAQEWLEKQLAAIQNNQAESFSTQAILDVLFVIHQMDQRSEGTIEKYQKEIDGLMAVLRQRVEESQKEDLSQQDLLNQPVFIPLRAMKDPRDIKILDPACGSGHFLLYAFDLLETIYKEYWDLEDQAEYTREDPSKGLLPLKEVYETKDALIADLPRLVIEYNLHGIDIDPRAVQIAGLSLWLRAQRGWQEQGIKPNDRFQIQKSNIVCAEPMPGETDMLREFADSLKPKVLGQLVEIIFEKMELAGEAGPLLKIEEEIADAVDKAREEFNKELLRRKEEAGYLPGMAPKDRERSLFDFSDLPDKTRFWEMAEDKILGALQDYAEQVENGDNSRRRLFANDAAKGFAFIDLCRKRYDVVLMNPPFGDFSESSEKYLIKNYINHCNNIISPFISRVGMILLPRAMSAAIFDKTVSIKSSYSKIRKEFLFGDHVLSIASDLGWGILDQAQVETVACVFSKARYSDSIKNVFIDSSYCHSKIVNTFPLKNAGKVPNLALSLNLPAEILNIFGRHDPFEPTSVFVRQGLGISDSWRWYRTKSETPIGKIGNDSDYAWLANGGGISPFFRDSDLTIYWKDNGYAIKQTEAAIYGVSSRTVKNVDFYFKQGLSYPKRTDVLNAHALPSGHIFTVEGQGCFPNHQQDMWHVLSLLNSKLLGYLINVFCGQHKGVGYIKQLPFSNLNATQLIDLSKKAYILKRTVSKYFCNTAIFRGPVSLYLQEFAEDIGLNSYAVNSFPERVESVIEILANCDDMLKKILDEIDELVFSAYKLSDQATEYIIENGPNSYHSILQGIIKSGNPKDQILSDVLDYALGLIFGRYSSGEIETNISLDPFGDAPPALPPAINSNNENFHKVIEIDRHEKCSHLDDMFRLFETELGVNAEEIENTLLSYYNSSNLSEIFSNNSKFFDSHLNTYSKSRRQAPIYWPLQTESGAYTLWIYYHSITEQTLYTCLNDYVEPKLKSINDNLKGLRNKSTRSKDEEKEFARLAELEAEIQEFRDELIRIAKFWKPNLNDGVQITAAPLWQLFRHRPWQNKLKDTWQKLEKGDYDWAHLAFSIWPKRVVKAAHKDRSIAIAHDLEENLWEEVEVGRDRQGNPKYQWQPRDLSQKELDSIIRHVSANT